MSMSNTITRTNLPGRFAIISLISHALVTRRQRNALRALDDAALQDMGLSRAEVEREANRPFWDVPAGWRR